MYFMTTRRLVLSAEVEAEQIYTDGVQSSEFFRTASRLTEMQSTSYHRACRTCLTCSSTPQPPIWPSEPTAAAGAAVPDQATLASSARIAAMVAA